MLIISCLCVSGTSHPEYLIHWLSINMNPINVCFIWKCEIWIWICLDLHVHCFVNGILSFYQAQNAALEAQANTELAERIKSLEQEVARHKEDSGKAQAEVDRLLEILREMENEKNDKDKKISELERWVELFVYNTVVNTCLSGLNGGIFQLVALLSILLIPSALQISCLKLCILALASLCTLFQLAISTQCFFLPGHVCSLFIGLKGTT